MRLLFLTVWSALFFLSGEISSLHGQGIEVIKESGEKGPKGENDHKGPSGQGPRFNVMVLEVEKPQPVAFPRLLLGGRPGLHLKVRLFLPGRFIIGVNGSKSKLTACTDDRGLDLLLDPLKKEDGQESLLRKPNIGFAPKPDNEGGCTVPVNAPGWPSAGAKRIRVKGTVAVVLGAKEVTIEKKDIAISEETQLGFGNLKPSLFGAGFTYQGGRALKSVSIIDSNGKECLRSLSRAYIESAAGEFIATIGLTKAEKSPKIKPKAVERFTVRLTYYDSVERMELPLDLDIGLGLNAALEQGR